MTEERNLLYLHKMLHEQAKHKQGDLKDLQTEQVKNMQKLLCLLAIEDGFAGFVRSQNRAFLAEAPNTCPEEAEIEALKAAGITALCFPCIRIADNGKSAKGMWLAETADGLKPIAAEFLRWGAEWKLWKLILEPTTDPAVLLPWADPAVLRWTVLADPADPAVLLPAARAVREAGRTSLPLIRTPVRMSYPSKEITQDSPVISICSPTWRFRITGRAVRRRNSCWNSAAAW